MIHLMHGFIAAGKTTRARAIEATHGAVRITPDEWMARLFGDDPPAALFRAKLATVLDLVRPLWLAVARHGGDAILDFGFWTRAERTEIASFLRGERLDFQWIVLDPPLDECRRRNTARNTGGTGTLHITDATFEFLTRGFEPIDPLEWETIGSRAGDVGSAPIPQIGEPMATIVTPAASDILRLLIACALPTEDLTPDHLRHFFGFEDQGALSGVVGLEPFGETALLRSLAVDTGHRGTGLGRSLVALAERKAIDLGTRELFLLTTTAEAFFLRLGYERLPRDQAPPAIRATTEFANLCPASSALLRKRLSGGP